MLASLKHRWRQRMADWVRRRQGLDTPPVSLQRRRIYILPTRGGIGFAALLFFMLLAGLNYANSLALFITFLLSGFALVSMNQCHRNLLGLTLVSANTFPAFAGQHGALHLIFEHEGAGVRHSIEADVAGEKPAVADLPRGARRRMELAIAAPRRGIVHIDRLRLSTTHPFSLFRAWTWVHMPLEMIVYPRPHGSLPMPGDDGHKPGTRPRGGAGADEWMSLRPFRDGDSPRQVAWKAYARGAPLLVKEYSETGSDQRVFDYSALANLQTEARLEQLSRWIVDAEANGERYGLRLPSLHVLPDHGLEHRNRCLTALALHDLEAHG